MKLDTESLKPRLQQIGQYAFRYRSFIAVMVVSGLLLFALLEVNTIYSDDSFNTNSSAAQAQIRQNQVEFDEDVIAEIRSRLSGTPSGEQGSIQSSPFDAPR